MAKATKEVKKKRAPANKMPEPLPAGLILQDLSKKEWRLGPSVGKGGFGEIYSAQEAGSKSSSSHPYVVKITEFSGIFSILDFSDSRQFQEGIRTKNVENFRAKHKLKTFGMPIFWGSGSSEYKGTKYRFIVIDKFGDDVYSLLQRNGGAFPVATVFQLALQLTYVLEYIHEFGYVHADLKGSNILMGVSSDNKNQAYLVDFGLATRFSTDQEFKPNPKRAHDGTIEYLSRDAHKGVPTRRGDMEILAYNVIHWLGGTLPWIDKIADANLVHQAKEEAMNDVGKFLKKCFDKKPMPDGLTKFLKCIKDMKFDQAPDYNKIRQFFVAEIKSAGGTLNGPLAFSSKQKRKSTSKDDGGGASAAKKKSAKEKEVLNDNTGSKRKAPAVKKSAAAKKGVKKGKPEEEQQEEGEESDEEWEDLDEKHGEVPGKGPKENGVHHDHDDDDDEGDENLPQNKKKQQTGTKRKAVPTKNKKDTALTNGVHQNGDGATAVVMTPAMLEIKSKMAAKKVVKKPATTKTKPAMQQQEENQSSKSGPSTQNSQGHLNDAMKEIMLKKEKANPVTKKTKQVRVEEPVAENGEERRLRRQLKAVSYDERTPKVPRGHHKK